MAKNKRRLSHKELNDLKEIENLIKTTKQKDNAPKPVYAIQQAKTNKQEQMLKVGDIQFPINKITMSDHSYDSAKDRFNMDKTTALGYFRSKINEATYVGIVEDDETGKPAHLFGYGRIAIYITLDLTTILTVYKVQKVTYNPIKEKVLEMHRKSFNRFVITERAKLKKLENLKLECDVEIAQCQLRLHKTRSEAVKNACNARILAIKQSLDEYQQEIEIIQSEKRRIAKSMISVI